jgi:hypothetical protein
METLTQPAVSVLVIDKPGYHIKLDSGSNLAEYIVKADAVLDDKMAIATKTDLITARPGTKYFLLVGSDGFFRVTRKARKMAASASFSDHLAAVACYTTNSSLALLGELYIKLNKPAVPTRVFYSKGAALEWLHSLMPERSADL